MSLILRRLWFLMQKEFIQVWRDRRLRIFLFLPPLVQLIIYGYTINFDLKEVPTAVFDEDRSPSSRQLLTRFQASPYFQITHYPSSQGQVNTLLDHGRVTLVVHLPAGFAETLLTGQPASVQLLIDATDSNTGLVVAKYAGAVLTDYAQEEWETRLARLGLRVRGRPVVLESRAWFNPNLISRNAFVPGVIALVVLLVSLMLTALAVVREKELGTLEQILVSPIRPLEFFLGKTVPFILISLADVVLVVFVGLFWFEMPFRGSPLVLALGTTVFLFSSVGLGLFISTVSVTQQQAVMAGTFLLTPAILLSGLIFPIANMPVFFQYATYLNPLRYFITVVQGILLRGVGVSYLWPEMAAMAALGLVLLTLSLLRFRTRMG